MDLRRPLDVVTASLDGEVLTVMALPPDRELTTGDIQRLIERRFGARRSIPGIRKTLERLAGQGIVHASRAGRVGVYALNTEHLAAEHVIDLALVPTRLRARVTEAIERWPTLPRCAAALDEPPSGAPDNGTLHLVLLTPASDDASEDRDWWDTMTARLVADVDTWTGARAVVHRVPEHRLDEGLNRDLLWSVRLDGEILLGELPPGVPRGIPPRGHPWWWRFADAW